MDDKCSIYSGIDVFTSYAVHKYLRKFCRVTFPFTSNPLPKACEAADFPTPMPGILHL